MAGSVLPSVLQKALLEGIFKVGRAQLSESLLNESNPLGSSRLTKLRHIFEEGKSLQLQFPAEDLGFRCHVHFHNNLSALHVTAPSISNSFLHQSNSEKIYFRYHKLGSFGHQLILVSP